MDASSTTTHSFALTAKAATAGAKFGGRLEKMGAALRGAEPMQQVAGTSARATQRWEPHPAASAAIAAQQTGVPSGNRLAVESLTRLVELPSIDEPGTALALERATWPKERPTPR